MEVRLLSFAGGRMFDVIWRVGVPVAVVSGAVRTTNRADFLPANVWLAVQFGCVLVCLVAVVVQARLAGIPLRREPGQVRLRWLGVALMLFVALCLASTMWSRVPQTTFARSMVLALAAAFVSACVSLRWRNLDVLLGDLRALVATVTALQLAGMAMALAGAPETVQWNGRLLGLTFNPNYTGFLSALAIMLTLPLLSRASSRREGVLIAGALLVLTASLAWSGSRGALIAAVLAVTANLFLSTSWNHARGRVALAFGAACVFAMGVLVASAMLARGPATPVAVEPITEPSSSSSPTPDSVREGSKRANDAKRSTGSDSQAHSDVSTDDSAPTPDPVDDSESVGDVLRDSVIQREDVSGEVSSTAGRLGLWRQSVEMLKEDPLLGKGYASSTRLEEMPGRNAHNLLLSVGVELGLVGVAIFFFLVFRMALLLRRSGPLSLLNGGLGGLAFFETTEASLLGLGNPIALVSWLLLAAFCTAAVVGRAPERTDVGGARKLNSFGGEK